MDERYSEYLLSDTWKAKRARCIALAGGQCECRGPHNGPLQVHHLTYARIFNEDMRDLMVLCKLHHLAVEFEILNGRFGREGDVDELRRKTKALFAGGIKQKPIEKVCIGFTHGIETRNPMQEKLVRDEQFMRILKTSEDRRHFLRDVRRAYSQYSNFAKIMTNACVIWKRSHRYRQGRC